MPPEVKAQFAVYRAAFDGRQVRDHDLLPLAGVVDRIGSAIAAGRPLSVVRLGDGEGGCLFWGHAGYGAMADYVAAQCLATHFGPQSWQPADFVALRDDIAGAARQADIVTHARKAAVRARVLADPRPELRGYVGATYADHWLSDQRDLLRGAVYQDGYLHAALLPHYADLLRGREIVVLGSRGAAFAVRAAQAFGARLAGVVEIPGQWSNGAQGDVRLYPQALPEARARLLALAGPGRVALVAAGLCAKGLCVAAAGRGAVALDVGSVMDVWAGTGVRGYQDAAMVERYRV